MNKNEQLDIARAIAYGATEKTLISKLGSKENLNQFEIENKELIKKYKEDKNGL